MKRMSLSLEPELWDELKYLARCDERPLQGYIRRVLREHVGRDTEGQRAALELLSMRPGSPPRLVREIGRGQEVESLSGVQARGGESAPSEA
jgi:hypothetical protein